MQCDNDTKQKHHQVEAPRGSSKEKEECMHKNKKLWHVAGDAAKHGDLGVAVVSARPAAPPIVA